MTDTQYSQKAVDIRIYMFCQMYQNILHSFLYNTFIVAKVWSWWHFVDQQQINIKTNICEHPVNQISKWSVGFNFVQHY